MVKELDFEPNSKQGKEAQIEKNRVRARERYQNNPEVQERVKQQSLERKRRLRKSAEYRAVENAERRLRRLKAKDKTHQKLRD